MDEPGHRVSGPGREDDDLDVSLLPEAMGDSGAQDGALADSTRSVQHGKTRGDEVRGNDLALALASEEE